MTGVETRHRDTSIPHGDTIRVLRASHWYVEDHDIRHTYIKPRSPQLNGKIERLHRSDQEKFLSDSQLQR
jgi:transposase InsO family protein